MLRLRLGLCFLLSGSAVASAQGNDIAAPAGGRATLMGNTGVALGRDGSASFYNPATIVRIHDERLAFAVNFYSLSITHMPQWHQPGAVDTARFGETKLSDTDLFGVNFRPLPSTLCLFLTIEELLSLATSDDAFDSDDAATPDRRAPTGKKLALCYATLESEDLDSQALRFRGETPAGPSSHVQSLLHRWSRTYIGGTYSVSLSRRFAIGASLQVVYTYDSFGISSESVSAVLDGPGVSSALSTAGGGRSFELTGTLGATYRSGRVTFGASLRLPSLHVYGDYQGTFAQSYSDGDQMFSLLAEGDGSFRSAPPMRLALGVGVALDHITFELNGALVMPLQHQLSADLGVHTSRLSDAGVKPSTTQEQYRIPGRTVANPSVGMEYFFSRGLSLLAGVSANISSLGRFEAVRSVGNLLHARVSHVAASLGLGSYWTGGELLFGVQLDYGWGRALTVNTFEIPNDWSVVDLNTYNVLFVISGSTNLNSIMRAVNTITSGGEPDDADVPAQTPTGVPARAGDDNPPQRPAARNGTDAPAAGPGDAPAGAAPQNLPPNPDAREAEGLSPDAAKPPTGPGADPPAH